MLAQGLEVLLERITMAVISRHEPPPSLARLGAYDQWPSWDGTISLHPRETADIPNAGQRQSRAEAVLDVHQS
jgi:hypothetical protein